MNNPDKLQIVTTTFNQWRSSRGSSGGRTPKALRQQAVQLLEQYQTTQIARALRTSNTTLKRWQHEINTAESMSQPLPEQNFIPVDASLCPMPQEPVQNHHSALQLTLNNNNGIHLTLSGDLTPQHLAVLVTSLTSQGGVTP